MVKNEITGVRPFNEFFFKSCYYHQLIAGLACFGIGYEEFLLSMFVFAKKSFELDTHKVSEKGMEKFLGYRSKICNLTEKKLIRHIDRGHPVLIGVDCFYLENRPDTYRQIHDPHFILAYGYDLQRRELKIIDHNYRNSFQYVEKVVSMDNILYANKMFGSGVLNRKTTCHVLMRKKLSRSVDKSFILQRYGAQIYEESRNNTMENLNQLKILIDGNVSALQERSDKITRYLQEMKNHYRRLCYISEFNDTEEKKLDIRNASNIYSNLLSVFWRMENKKDFAYVSRNSEQVFRKIDSLIEAESRIYDYIMEKFLCHSKR